MSRISEHASRYVVDWLTMLEGAAGVLTMGLWDPQWSMAYLMWRTKRKCRAYERRKEGGGR